MTLLLIASQLPVVALFTWIYLKDIHGKEPLHILIKTTFLGALISIPVGFAEELFSSLTHIGNESVGLDLLIYSVVGVAAFEEFAKFLILLFYNYRLPELDEPFDGIMYAVAVSLGFAAFENLIYVLQFGMATAVLRAVTAVPVHALTGVLMGYYLGKAKFGDPSVESQTRWRGLLAAILIHGFYDFGAFQGQLVLMAIVIFVELRLAKRALSLHQQKIS